MTPEFFEDYGLFIWLHTDIPSPQNWSMDDSPDDNDTGVTGV